MTQVSSFTARQSRLTAALSKAGLNGIALNPGPSLVYLTGLHFHLMERPVVALFTPHTTLTLVIPELEAAKVAALPFKARVFFYGEDPAKWPDIFRQAAQAARVDEGEVGAEPTRLRLLELRMLETAAPKTKFISGEEVLASLRMSKDEDELAAMRKAVDIAQKALEATIPQIKAGVTERQLASELSLQLLRCGSDSEFPFTPIVSGGPNSANPHATPTDRALRKGDLLVIDWGAAYEGYFSDLTRTFAIGRVDDELEKIVEIVQEANAAGRAAGRPGLACSEVDRAARQVIEKSGYGQYFTHRTGHGLGMEGHEAPYMRAGNTMLLEPGMTYTVEPGIYLPERGGVRIEDDVFVTASGAESLSDMPRSLRYISA